MVRLKRRFECLRDDVANLEQSRVTHGQLTELAGVLAQVQSQVNALAKHLGLRIYADDRPTQHLVSKDVHKL